MLPDRVTFIGVLSACSHSGLISEAYKYFDSMTTDYGIKPEIEHYSCLVDALGRAGRVKEAEKLITTMPFEASASMYRALLGACRLQGDMETGKRVATKLLELEPFDSSAYVLLSNIYAASNQWSKVADARTKMMSKNVKKDPGCSWINVKMKAHAFVVDDRSHPENEKIYEKFVIFIYILPLISYDLLVMEMIRLSPSSMVYALVGITGDAETVVITDPIIYLSNFYYISWYQEPKFLFKMPLRRSEGEELEYLFFEGNGSSFDEWRPRNRRREEEDEESEENPFDNGSSSDEQSVLRPMRNQREDNRRWESGMRVNIPDFDGDTLNPERFIDWLAAVEEVFEFKEVPENKKRLQNLKQGSKSIEDYTTKFYQLIARNDIQEREDQLVSRYIGGLRVQIMDSVNMFDPMTLSDAFQRNAISRFAPNQAKAGGGNTRPVPKAAGSNGLKCFNCGEHGHRQSECKKVGKRHLFVDPEDNDDDVAYDDYEGPPIFNDEPEYEEEYVSEDVGVNLVVRRSCLTPKADGDDWLKHNIFQSTCIILGKVCTFVYDSGSCDNLIAEEAVHKLGLKTENRPKPYKLQWLKKVREVTVSKRVHVPFSVRTTYKDNVWCDVVAMDAYHLLLGRHWEYDRDITHNRKTNNYSFLFGGVKITLMPNKPKEVVNKPTGTLLTLLQFEDELEMGDDIFVLIGKEHEELRRQVEELISKGYVRESMGPCAVPALLTLKKDGTWRMCVDSRAINKITVRYRFPISRLDDLLDQISGVTIFTKLDLKSGASFNEHVTYVRHVLPCFGRTVFMQPRRSVFTTPKVLFLGYVVSGDSIRVDESKVAAVQEWPTPTTIMESRVSMESHCVDGGSRVGFLGCQGKAYYSTNLVFELHTDASKVAIGGVLSQGGRPVAYFSEKLTEPKSRHVDFEVSDFVWAVLTKDRFPVGEYNKLSAKKIGPHVDFEVGDFVWAVLTKDRFPVGEYNKLSAKKIGPLEIMKMMNSNAYRLKLPSHILCSDVFNVKHLLPYHGNSSNEYSVGNLRTNFVYPGRNDVNTSIEEWADLFLEAQDRVRKNGFTKVSITWAPGGVKGNANVDVFDVLKNAIKVAASDHPNEFRTMRNKIAEMLFSRELINYCGGGDMSFKKQSMNVSCEVQDETTDKAQVKSAEDNASKGPLNHEQKVADKSYGDEYELVVYKPKSLDMERKINSGKTIVPNVPRVTPHQQCKSANPELVRNNQKGPRVTLGLQCKSRIVSRVTTHNQKAPPRVTPDQQSKSRIISKVAANNQKGPRVAPDKQFKSPMNSKEATNTKSGATNTSFQEKLEATKRKFQQHYMEEENLKKKRRIQVLELHEVIKKGRIPPKDQQVRHVSKQFRR
nr:hypothetical protein [Tanacetum cinerariifolium]